MCASHFWSFLANNQLTCGFGHKLSAIPVERLMILILMWNPWSGLCTSCLVCDFEKGCLHSKHNLWSFATTVCTRFCVWFLQQSPRIVAQFAATSCSFDLAPSLRRSEFVTRHTGPPGRCKGIPFFYDIIETSWLGRDVFDWLLGTRKRWLASLSFPMSPILRAWPLR